MAGIIAIAVLLGSLIANAVTVAREEKRIKAEMEARYLVPPCNSDNCGKTPDAQ